MSVLICKNVVTEGPDTIEDFLKSKGHSYTILEMSENNDIPEHFDTLILLGGPMSVNDIGLYPYLAKEQDLIRQFIEEDKKILGICLGSQLIAKTLGSNVYKGSKPELGWCDIKLTDEGLEDLLFKELAINPETAEIDSEFEVFHLHGETFDIPKECSRIAGSKLYENQAFKYGNKVYALQFHIEVYKKTVFDWLKDEKVDFEELKEKTDRLYEIYNRRAVRFYEYFFEKM